MAALAKKFVLMLALLAYAESTFGLEVRLETQFAFHFHYCMLKVLEVRNSISGSPLAVFV